ncbi:BON domain-containing protein [Hahella aquimaris]|uniref:BON domain-containing protein n=1 Tax=Hahella sp. HNIBRBA332 TaxID=3015983 RepID=UPI00273B984B|nr:BON domain-containing protein [Hahella sp. HNIBRBA332]WLQ16712.1 BON domain-containing protein [Hahella sp. HNIBRBA332]
MTSNKRFTIYLLAMSLAFWVGCSTTSSQESTGEYIDDSVLTAKVIMAVFNEPSLKTSEINVETYKGVVQLSGFVNSQADIDKAVKITGNVDGVKSVSAAMKLK